MPASPQDYRALVGGRRLSRSNSTSYYKLYNPFNNMDVPDPVFQDEHSDLIPTDKQSKTVPFNLDYLVFPKNTPQPPSPDKQLQTIARDAETEDDDTQEALEAYEKCQIEGRHLMRLMESSYTEASDTLERPAESPHSHFTACSIHGWIRRMTSEHARQGKPWPLDTFERVRQLVPTMLRSLQIGFQHSVIEGAQWQHIVPWRFEDGSASGEATKGNFFNLYEPEARVIYRMENNCPSHASQGKIKPLPMMRHWSDLTFLTYAHFAGVDVHPLIAPVPLHPLSPPRYIISINVINDTTWSVIQRLLSNLKGTTDMSKLPPWPGLSFSGWSDEGAALIGTPIVAGTAWMLIERKLAMGVHVVHGVYVFGGDEGQDGDPMVNILVEVGEAPGGRDRRGSIEGPRSPRQRRIGIRELVEGG